MKVSLRVLAVIALLAAVMLMAAPTQAASGNLVCTVDPGTGPIGTTFTISCTGFSANTILNIYAVEPDGRASGLNIYGFFPTSVKTDKTGTATFQFVTETNFSSVGPGRYIFVVHELGAGGVVAEIHVPIDVQSSPRPLVGAVLASEFVGTATGFSGIDVVYAVTGTGYVPGEGVNIWVTQPPVAQCSGLGIDQLSLAALAGNGSSLWSAPGMVKADKDGNIAFNIAFHSSACRGEHIISARSPASGIGGQVPILVQGLSVRPANATVTVTPGLVPAYHSFHVVSGTGFPANAGINCWYTRPDGRVLFFLNVNAKADATGSFSVGSVLDDFPPFTSTEPGTWQVTCATPNRSALGLTSFQVVGLPSDP